MSRLTKVAHVIYQNNFFEDFVWCEADDTGHSPKQGIKFFVVETNDDAGSGQFGWVLFFKTPAGTNKRGRNDSCFGISGPWFQAMLQSYGNQNGMVLA